MSDKSDDAINKILKSKGFEGLSVEGVGKGEHGGIETAKIVLNGSIDNDILEKALLSKDELMTVLLLSFEIELQLSNFLEDLFGEPQGGLSFHGLVSNLKACRFENDIVTIVDSFRKLRNKFAHEKNASLEKHKVIVDSIFNCKFPSPTEYEVTTIKYSEGAEGVKIEDLPIIERLVVFANGAILFLAVANQIFNFPRPSKRVAIHNPASFNKAKKDT